jgi:hypothetical protein
MSAFHWPRFRRVFLNDLQQQWRKVWIASLALAGVALIAYLTNLAPRGGPPEIYVVLYPMILLGGGLLFTSTIFADLHHPLQKFHYLTLPCSNLERFLSRYLLTGPLLVLYVLITYAAFDFIASLIASGVTVLRAAPFAPLDPRIVEVTMQYLQLHALMLLGAIFFRSYALPKSLIAGAVIGFGLVAVQLVTVRLVFWEYFTTIIPSESVEAVRLLSLPRPLVAGLIFLLYLWVLYLAYQCLREHEVQGEL